MPERHLGGKTGFRSQNVSLDRPFDICKEYADRLLAVSSVRRVAYRSSGPRDLEIFVSADAASYGTELAITSEKRSLIAGHPTFKIVFRRLNARTPAPKGCRTVLARPQVPREPRSYGPERYAHM